MSRVGKAPVKIPAGVSVSVNGNTVSVKGPKGTLNQEFDTSCIGVTVEGSDCRITRTNDEDATKAKHGLYRALVHNMVKGVTDGYEKNLVVNGVGWKMTQQGKDIVLSIGFSHTITYKAVDGITLTVVTPTEVSVKGYDKNLVGQIAANIRAIRKPEPYHGYGIAYKDEVIERKQGKTAGK